MESQCNEMSFDVVPYQRLELPHLSQPSEFMKSNRVALPFCTCCSNGIKVKGLEQDATRGRKRSSFTDTINDRFHPPKRIGDARALLAASFNVPHFAMGCRFSSSDVAHLFQRPAKFLYDTPDVFQSENNQFCHAMEHFTYRYDHNFLPDTDLAPTLAIFPGSSLLYTDNCLGNCTHDVCSKPVSTSSGIIQSFVEHNGKNHNLVMPCYCGAIPCSRFYSNDCLLPLCRELFIIGMPIGRPAESTLYFMPVSRPENLQFQMVPIVKRLAPRELYPISSSFAPATHCGAESDSLLCEELYDFEKFELLNKSMLITSIAVLLDNVAQLGKTDKKIKIFDAEQIPVIHPRDYFLRLVTHFNCSPACHVLSLIYLDRLCRRFPAMEVDMLNIHRLLLASTICAAKFYEDEAPSMNFYAKVGGICCSELKKLETWLLWLLDYRLVVQPAELAYYCNLLRRIVFM